MKISVVKTDSTVFAVKIMDGADDGTKMFVRVDTAEFDRKDSVARDEARDVIMEAVSKTKILSTYSRGKVLETIEAAIQEIFGDATNMTGAPHA